MHIFIIIILFMLGACFGSFLNVVALRSISKRSFLLGRSECPNCKRTLLWHDLVPVLSWLFLRGRCRFCRKGISIQYLLVETITGIVFVFGSIMIVDIGELILYLVFTSFFIVLFICDAVSYEVPDKIVIPGIILVFIINSLVSKNPFLVLIGACVGGSWFLVQFILSRGRWVGGGDIRIGALIGALLGFRLIWVSLGLAYISGSILAVILMVFGKKTFKSKLPFATLLLPSAFVAWFYGERLLDWYFNLIS